MQMGLIDTMTGPYQGNILPAGVPWGADNGRFTENGPRVNWMGHDRWYRWLAECVDRYGADICHFALVPDVPFDAAGTLDEFLPWADKVRDLGIPAAFAAQNGCEAYGIPWDDLDVLFLAGGPTVPGDKNSEWKLGPVAHRLTIKAKELGKPVHMGRANSRRRLQIAEWFGCDTADGTFLKKAPDTNLERVRRVWLDDMHRRPSLAFQED